MRMFGDSYVEMIPTTGLKTTFENDGTGAGVEAKNMNGMIDGKKKEFFFFLSNQRLFDIFKNLFFFSFKYIK